ncbi:MAG: twin-arginine translocase TatA/TatE family subunit [Bryobacterales bacterium]|nr:twin-arginine translocase TatA/TatE family subunit [Bryobacterales bacterium]
MGPIGVQEMVLIFLVALVLFGPRKLPELAKNLGKAVTEFRRAQSELKDTFQREMQTIEKENQSLKEVTRQTAAELASASEFNLGSTFDSSHDDIQHGTESNPDQTPVSASAVLGAESHAEPYDGSYRPAEAAAETPRTETNPLPEFVQAGGGSASKADAEFPSIA